MDGSETPVGTRTEPGRPALTDTWELTGAVSADPCTFWAVEHAVTDKAVAASRAVTRSGSGLAQFSSSRMATEHGLARRKPAGDAPTIPPRYSIDSPQRRRADEAAGLSHRVSWLPRCRPESASSRQCGGRPEVTAQSGRDEDGHAACSGEFEAVLRAASRVRSDQVGDLLVARPKEEGVQSAVGLRSEDVEIRFRVAQDVEADGRLRQAVT